MAEVVYDGSFLASWDCDRMKVGKARSAMGGRKVESVDGSEILGCMSVVWSFGVMMMMESWLVK
jgi:hypothetical protein